MLASAFAGCGDGADENPTAACNAQHGAELYAKSCAACHGLSGEGAIGKALNTWSGDENKLITIIDEQMPPADPKQCDAACACDIAAYIVLLAVLLLRPQGLFGGAALKKV